MWPNRIVFKLFVKLKLREKKMLGKLLLVAELCCLFFPIFGHQHEVHGNKRDALLVKFKEFKTVPRTEQEALDNGFIKVSDCETGTFRGKQYMKNDDPAVIPLYDANGYIAGLQTGVPKGLENNYPPSNIKPPFIADGQYYKLTAYFTHPSMICSGRSEQQFNRTGTGQDLFFQSGVDPEKDLLEVIEHQEKTDWVKGLCFPKMGFHYFKEVSSGMNCNDFYPIALLYYKGQLEGFVWSLGAILNTTYVNGYEYPEPDFFFKLIEKDDVPDCLLSLRRSTLHVYFRNNVDTFTCEEDTSLSSGLTMSILNISLLLTLLKLLQ